MDVLCCSFDLTLSVFEEQGRLCLLLQANAHLFLDATVQRMMGHLQVHQLCLTLAQQVRRL